VTHQDFKLENIGLVYQQGGPPLVKVFDFGLALLVPTSGLNLDAELKLCEEVAMSFTADVRPPEIMLGSSVRHTKNDIWALGIVLSRVLRSNVPLGVYRKQPGYRIQNRILEYIPWVFTENLTELPGYTNWDTFAKTHRKPIHNLGEWYSPQQVQLLQSCLCWDPADRKSAKEIMQTLSLTLPAQKYHGPQVSPLEFFAPKIMSGTEQGRWVHSVASWLIEKTGYHNTARLVALHLGGSFLPEELPEEIPSTSTDVVNFVCSFFAKPKQSSKKRKRPCS
jgi:serine/threonine protein kinase